MSSKDAVSGRQWVALRAPALRRVTPCSPPVALRASTSPSDALSAAGGVACPGAALRTRRRCAGEEKARQARQERRKHAKKNAAQRRHVGVMTSGYRWRNEGRPGLHKRFSQHM
eukprot:CAMPEP_0198609916 /NCGR_PEP_ID=MMETSP1462-20131121/156634_1 /TAXON_ID=1333877 /ORGANISM="Brandtodinium nutriculum, Strain RCC3387" /LENGTH=113 /DNA_ID=CAMNT_0044341723 /DNA_START=1071 /DNA_END=1412 /DNA_ORIENTATION=+